MNLDQINDWFDSFYEEYIKGKKPIRGRIFSGAHIEVWSRRDIAVVVHDPYPRGQDAEQKAADFVRGLHDENKNLHAEMTTDRFQQIVSGQYRLTDSDWVWDDE